MLFEKPIPTESVFLWLFLSSGGNFCLQLLDGIRMNPNFITRKVIHLLDFKL